MNLIHNLDSMVGIIDPQPERIYAEYVTARTPVEVEDFLSFVMRLADGTVVSVDGSSAAIGGESLGDRFYGTKGQIAIGPGGLRVYLEQPCGDLPAGQWVKVPKPEQAVDTRTVMVDRFAEAIKTGGEVPVSGVQGRRALEIARGAYLSMQQGGPVTFPVQDDD